MTHNRHSPLYLGIAVRHKQKEISEGVHRICRPTPRNMKEERAEYKILLRRFTLKQLFVKKRRIGSDCQNIQFYKRTSHRSTCVNKWYGQILLVSVVIPCKDKNPQNRWKLNVSLSIGHETLIARFIRSSDTILTWLISKSFIFISNFITV